MQLDFWKDQVYVRNMWQIIFQLMHKKSHSKSRPPTMRSVSLASSLQAKPSRLIITPRKSGHDINVTCHADGSSIISTAKRSLLGLII